ncbi:hypothetical protein [Geminicoccus flavidas]|uniref:hypothetical protein n=1 Tax=Geminicoccus flavidas TaxID=2506407 RepID=UPI00135677A2|nr:hypothetical protein [Geminicoccus flavidas]
MKPDGSALISLSQCTTAVGRDTILFLGLGAISVLKGLNWALAPEGSYLYYIDYRFGFLMRGLVGQIFSPFLARLPHSAHEKVFLAWHFLTLTVLLVLLVRLAAQTVAQSRRVDVLAMAALLFCSPFLASLAYFTAAPDILLCLLTLGVVAAIRARRFLLAWLIFLVGVLIHQLMVFIALPLMVLFSMIGDELRTRAVAGSLAIGLAACLVILMAPAPDPRLIRVFIDQGISPEGARDLYDFQLSQELVEISSVMAGWWLKGFINGMIAVAYGALPGVAILGGCLVLLRASIQAVVPLPLLRPGRPRAILTAILVLGVGLSPLLVLAMAWDLSRFAALCPFTAFLVAVALVGFDRRQLNQSGPSLLALTCIVLAVAYLCLPFLGLWFGGWKLNADRPFIRDPILALEPMRTAIESFLRFYDRNVP